MARTDILDDFDFDDSSFFEGGDEGEVIAKYYSILEAEVAAARLRAEGIPCFLANVSSHTVMPHLQLLVRLHVRPQDTLHAREILGEAAIDAETEPFKESEANTTVILTVLAIAIGIILALLLVQALRP